jgi:hypothetical protein
MKPTIIQNSFSTGVSREVDKFQKIITGRAPARADLFAVSNIVIFAVFGWSVRGFLFKMPAFALYFGLWDNLLILFYQLAFALLESLIIMAALTVVAMLLSSRLLRDGFAYKGFITILVASVALIMYQGYYEQIEFYDRLRHNDYTFFGPILYGLATALAILFFLLWIFQRWPRLQKLALMLIDQFEIFTYLYVPLGIVGLLLVIVRNAL